MRDSDDDEQAEKDYNPFLVNRGLSYFADTVAMANEMNQFAFIDKKMQYEFLLHAVRKKKRFSKWHKKEDDSRIEVLMEHYQCSYQRAIEYLSVLTEEQVSSLVEYYKSLSV